MSDTRTDAADGGQLDSQKRVSGASLTVLTSIIGIVLSVLAAVTEAGKAYVEEKRQETQIKVDANRQETQIKLEEARQRAALQVSFFDRAIDPTRPSLLRHSVLTFLAGSPRIESDVQTWAKSELTELDKQIARELEDKGDKLASAIAVSNDLVKKTVQGNPQAAQAARETLLAHRVQIDSLSDQVSMFQQAAISAKALPNARCKTARLHDNLRSGVSDGAANQRCGETAARHTQGEKWIERADELAFECACES